MRHDILGKGSTFSCLRLSHFLTLRLPAEHKFRNHRQNFSKKSKSKVCDLAVNEPADRCTTFEKSPDSLITESTLRAEEIDPAFFHPLRLR
jgi:hypothetical protein